MSMVSTLPRFKLRLKTTRKWSVVLSLKKNHRWEEAIYLEEIFETMILPKDFKLHVKKECVIPNSCQSLIPYNRRKCVGFASCYMLPRVSLFRTKIFDFADPLSSRLRFEETR